MTTRRILGSLALVSTLSACSSMGAGGPQALATMEPTRGNTAAGTVRFEQTGKVVRVTVKLGGLTPNQAHGFHAHEKGDCSSGDGLSAGGHFNPAGKPHGPQEGEHHAGDFPALQADAGGRVEASFVLRQASIGSGTADLLGRGLIVHAAPDDYTTQPTGNSGARIACGVIRPG